MNNHSIYKLIRILKYMNQIRKMKIKRDIEVRNLKDFSLSDFEEIRKTQIDEEILKSLLEKSNSNEQEIIERTNEISVSCS